LRGDVQSCLALMKRLTSQGVPAGHQFVLGAVWDSTTRGETLSEEEMKERVKLADAAKQANWQLVEEILSKSPKFVNACRPGSHHLYAPLHQAAHNGAPPEFVTWLIEKGAWRTLRNAQGKRPLDVAEKHGRTALVKLLKPQYRLNVPEPT